MWLFITYYNMQWRARYIDWWNRQCSPHLVSTIAKQLGTAQRKQDPIWLTRVQIPASSAWKSHWAHTCVLESLMDGKVEEDELWRAQTPWRSAALCLSHALYMPSSINKGGEEVKYERVQKDIHTNMADTINWLLIEVQWRNNKCFNKYYWKT